MELFAQVSIGWEELARQVPLLAVALLVSWYAFKHISQQQSGHLDDLRKTYEMMLKTLADAHAKLDTAKDAQITALSEAIRKEQEENRRLLQAIEKIGGMP